MQASKCPVHTCESPLIYSCLLSQAKPLKDVAQASRSAVHTCKSPVVCCYLLTSQAEPLVDIMQASKRAVHTWESPIAPQAEPAAPGSSFPGSPRNAAVHPAQAAAAHLDPLASSHAENIQSSQLEPLGARHVDEAIFRSRPDPAESGHVHETSFRSQLPTWHKQSPGQPAQVCTASGELHPAAPSRLGLAPQHWVPPATCRPHPATYWPPPTAHIVHAQLHNAAPGSPVAAVEWPGLLDGGLCQAYDRLSRVPSSVPPDQRVSRGTGLGPNPFFEQNALSFQQSRETSQVPSGMDRIQNVSSRNAPAAENHGQQLHDANPLHAGFVNSKDSLNRYPNLSACQAQAAALSDDNTALSSQTGLWTSLGADAPPRSATIGDGCSAVGWDDIARLAAVQHAAADVFRGFDLMHPGTTPTANPHSFCGNGEAAAGSEALQPLANKPLVAAALGIPAAAQCDSPVAEQDTSTSCTGEDPFEQAMRNATIIGRRSWTEIQELDMPRMNGSKPDGWAHAALHDSNRHSPASSMAGLSRSLSGVQHASHAQRPLSSRSRGADALQDLVSRVNSGSLLQTSEPSLAPSCQHPAGGNGMSGHLSLSRRPSRGPRTRGLPGRAHGMHSMGKMQSREQRQNGNHAASEPHQALVGQQESQLLKLLHGLASPVADTAAGLSPERLSSLKEINSLQGVLAETGRFRIMQRSHVEVRRLPF